jgi:hypothetical protein
MALGFPDEKRLSDADDQIAIVLRATTNLRESANLLGDSVGDRDCAASTIPGPENALQFHYSCWRAAKSTNGTWLRRWSRPARLIVEFTRPPQAGW